MSVMNVECCVDNIKESKGSQRLENKLKRLRVWWPSVVEIRICETFDQRPHVWERNKSKCSRSKRLLFLASFWPYHQLFSFYDECFSFFRSRYKNNPTQALKCFNLARKDSEWYVLLFMCTIRLHRKFTIFLNYRFVGVNELRTTWLKFVWIRITKH